MDLICTVPTPHLLGPATWAQRLSAFLVYILRNLSKSAGFVSLAGEALSFLYLMLPYFYDRSMFIYRFVRFSWKKRCVGKGAWWPRCHLVPPTLCIILYGG